MNEESKSFWWKIWGRPVRSFLWLALFSAMGIFVSSVIIHKIRGGRGLNGNDFVVLWSFLICNGTLILAALGLILSAIPQTRFLAMWMLRRWFFCTAALATLIALFYAEEDWRGKRAWEQRKIEMRARGIELNWETYIPATVPDDQNIFKAPKMQEWFVGRGIKDLDRRLGNRLTDSVGTSNAIVTETAARDYLAWSDKFAPDFDLIRQGLQRPFARMDGNYSEPALLPIPGFVTIRTVARSLAQRAHCHFLLHEPDKALSEVTLMHDLCRLCQGAPTGKPMTLVAAMINVAVTGLYADTIREGFRLHAWQEAQLTALQRQLKDIRLMTFVAEAFETEPAAVCRTIETASIKKVFSSLESGIDLFSVMPRGWLYLSLVSIVDADEMQAHTFDPVRDSVSPAASKEALRRMETFLAGKSPFKIAARIAVPNFIKATQTTVRNQNSVNEALIACALERYHIAHGEYPESLDALTPQFIEKVPHDIIDGGPLKYRKNNDSFVLYSIGWNEEDDGGTPAKVDRNGTPDSNDGDWVWLPAPR